MKLNLNRNKRYAIPIMTHPGIELIEKTVKAAVTDGQTHADAIIALSENTPSDAATVIMDLTVEAEAFGAQLQSPLRASPDAWCAVASVTRPEAVAGQVRPVVPTTIP